MKKIELHNQIALILKKLANNSEKLALHTGKFSQLETDLLRKQCIELYDLINQLHLANVMDKVDTLVNETSLDSDFKVEKEFEMKEKEKIEVNEKFEINEPVIIATILEPKIEFEKIEPEPEIVIMAEKVEEIKQTIIKPNFDAPKFEPVAEKPIIPKPAPIKLENEEINVLDKLNLSKATETLHESMTSKNEENELLHRFANSKIYTLKEAIDISKRFELQANLFGGDSTAYNNSIIELENAENKEEALDLFNTLANQYHWDKENILMLELKSFIYRKY